MTYDPRDPDGLIEAMVEDGRRSSSPSADKASETKPKAPYRGIAESLPHDEEFQSLTPQAKLVYFFLCLQLGVSGIDVLYPETLPRQTGLSSEDVQEAIAQLMRVDWLETGGNIFWLIDALRDDPTSFTLNNPNHRKSVQKHINALPRQSIVNRFAEYYSLDYPFAELEESPHPESHRDPIPDQEKGDRRYEIGEIGISGKKRKRSAQKKSERSQRSEPPFSSLEDAGPPPTTCPSCGGGKPTERTLCETCEYTRRNSVGAVGGRWRDDEEGEWPK